MRLIDADKLLGVVMPSTLLSDGFKQVFKCLVDGEPTSPTPPAKGEWIAKTTYNNGEYNWRECSVCGYTQIGTAEPNFCPECGAKMCEYEEES